MYVVLTSRNDDKASGDAAEPWAARPGAPPLSGRASPPLCEDPQCDGYLDHGNPQGGRANVRDGHDKTEDGRCRTGPAEQTLLDSTSACP